MTFARELIASGHLADDECEAVRHREETHLSKGTRRDDMGVACRWSVPMDSYTCLRSFPRVWSAGLEAAFCVVGGDRGNFGARQK